MKSLDAIVKESCPNPANGEAWMRQRATAKAIADRFSAGYRSILLADEVGMGKTYTALAAMAHRIYQEEKVNNSRILLIVPTNHTLASKWEREIHKFNNEYLQGRLGESKRLRPIVLNKFMDLVKNLHDYGDVPMERQPVYIKEYFKDRLARWVKRSRRHYKKGWCGECIKDEMNPNYLGISSLISPRALELFFSDEARKNSDDNRLDKLIGILEEGGEEYNPLRELLGDFLRRQDSFEANILIIRMNALHRNMNYNNKDFQLFCTYLAGRTLMNTKYAWRKGAYQTLKKNGLLAWDGNLVDSLVDKLNKFAEIDLWGLKDDIDAVLREDNHSLREVLRGERECESLQDKCNECMGKVVRKKLASSGITLAVVDEVHNWKNGYSNGAWRFRQCFGPGISDKLAMSATPIQLRESEMKTLFEVVAGCDDTDKSLVAVSDASKQGGPIQNCLDAEQAFQMAWDSLNGDDVGHLHRIIASNPDVRNALESLRESNDVSLSSLRAFAQLGLRYRDALDSYRDSMKDVCIRHLKDRTIRGFFCGEEFPHLKEAPRPHIIYATRGMGESANAMLDFIGMRAQQLIGQAAGKKEGARLLGGLNSSYEAFREGKRGKALAAGSEVGDYVEFFHQRISEVRRHPKVEATVTRCLKNFRMDRKTLVFCERLATQEKILGEIRERLDETKEEIKVMRERRTRFLQRETTDFWYSFCLPAPVSLDADALNRLVAEKLNMLESKLGRSNFLKLLDLCLLHIAHPDNILGECAGLILNNGEALQLYFASPIIQKSKDDDPASDEPDSALDDDSYPADALPREADGPTEEMVQKGVARILDGDSVWRYFDADENPLAIVDKLVDSERKRIDHGGEEAVASDVARIMRAISMGLRHILFHFSLFHREEQPGEAGFMAANELLKPTQVGSRAKAVCGFLQQILDADGSIQSGKEDGKTLRQSLWHAAMASRDSFTAQKLNGDTDADSRDNRCSAFNTPLEPHILICTAIGSEGIDLHLQCAEVIHHDLPWNPAKLEQRTGRVDRVGSLAVRTGTGIRVGIPFLASNYDEIAYNTVLARAQKMEVLFGQPEFVEQGLSEEKIDDNGNEKIIEPNPDLHEPMEGGTYCMPESLVDFFRVDFQVSANAILGNEDASKSHGETA